MSSDAHDETDSAEGAISPADEEAIGREFLRILGTEFDGRAEGPPWKFFWLLPLASPADFVAFLERIPSNAGVAGLEAAARRVTAEVLERGTLQHPDAAG